MKFKLMILPSFTFRFVLFGSLAALASSASAQVAPRIVFQNGRSVPVAAAALQGNLIALKAPVEGFNPGQTFPMESADHIYGDKPLETNRAIALLLMDQPADAIKLLEPVLAAQQITAKIPGNFWLEAAEAALVAYSLNRDTAKSAAIGKEISDATPAQGIDPFVSLGRALALPPTTTNEERETAFRELTTDNLPTAVCAYASFFRAKSLKQAKDDAGALEAFLQVPCLYPSGGMILNAIAEFHAAEYLTALGRREEAVALLQSCVRQAGDTVILSEANKRLESSK